MQISLQFYPSPRGGAPRPSQTDRIEAMFLQSFLKNSGMESGMTAFSGGIGESQFSSFLTAEYARILAGRIDLGLGDFAPREGE